ncbi:MAG: terminase [Bifidobacteriaceae bacterium]|jgi:hypothetical protein|nr:terminase [Bifidobacteriaceae bacterium]
METVDGLIFTPHDGADKRPTIWNSQEWGGKIPRSEINAAWDELNRRYKIECAYCDPGFRDEISWELAIEAWDQRYGPKKFIPWVHEWQLSRRRRLRALLHFEADLEQHRITQDGCPFTITHIGNAKKIAKPADRYGLGKPEQDRKIDAAVTTVLVHEAAEDARDAGWDKVQHNFIITGSITRRSRRSSTSSIPLRVPERDFLLQ